MHIYTCMCQLSALTVPSHPLTHMVSLPALTPSFPHTSWYALLFGARNVDFQFVFKALLKHLLKGPGNPGNPRLHNRNDQCNISSRGGAMKPM